MKKKIKKYITALLLVVALILPSSCSKDFLDVVDPNVLDEGSYPAAMEDFELLMNGLYGRLRQGFYNSENGYKVPLLLGKEIDNGYSGSNFNEYAINNMNPDLGVVRQYWENMYLHVAKLNDFIIKLEDFKAMPATPITDNDKVRIEQMFSEAKFLRAFVYFHLINLYGADPVLTAADMDKNGVPLWTEKVTDIASATKPRATQRQIWDLIISDLTAAIPPLEGIGYINDERPRVDEWATKTLLAKAYMFTRDFSAAVPVLKDIIDNSNKQLAPFNIYRNMFNGWNKYNVESIFEINSGRDTQTNNQMSGPVLTWQRFVGPTYINATGKSDINGNANFYVGDGNITRFGFNDSPWGYETKNLYPISDPNDLRTGVVNAAYKDYSFKARADKSLGVDPRLYINTLQPFIDTVLLENTESSRPSGWLLIYKSRQEGYDDSKIRAWPSRKGNNLETKWINNNGINHYVFRLADVYLLYAEALIESGGNTADALEYINKVRRRAYNQPVHTASADYTDGVVSFGFGDYVTLNDRTATLDSKDHLANDVLKYERWAELHQEGWWWYDVRRWDIGKQEVEYFKQVNSGVLQFNRTGFYSLPIPQYEMDANSAMEQNDPY
jgi:hypothetical protein